MKGGFAMLGGSFDPVHLGHLFLLHCAVTLSPYSSFFVVPAAQSNFKRDNSPVAGDFDRLEMLKLALEDYKELYPDDAADVRILDCELKKGGISYTYETVISVKKQYGIDGRLGLVIGDDHIGQLTKWYEFERLKEEVEFVICRRLEKPQWDKVPCGVKYLRIEPQFTMPQSASDIRENGHMNTDNLSKRVIEYVRRKNLYR